MTAEQTPATVSTHVLDTSAGRPAAAVAVEASVKAGPDAPWTAHGTSATDADGRCKDLPPLPPDATHVRLRFAVEPYLAARAEAGQAGTPHAEAPHTGTPHTRTHPTHTHRAEAQQDAPRADRDGPRDSGVFFPEVAVVFAAAAGEHYHVPLLLNPFGYSVYRGS